MQSNQILTDTISVDPGDHSGWAYWQGTLCPHFGQFNLQNKVRSQILEDQLSCQWREFCQLIDEYKPRTVFLEGVEFWEGSLKSLTAAKRQNLSKLSYLVGGYAEEALRRGITTRIFPARVWKGQMSNEILEAKVYRINNTIYPSEHILNAVGIGMSRMGLFLNTKSHPSRINKYKKRNLQWM